jgi:hypothetical protein
LVGGRGLRRRPSRGQPAGEEAPLVLPHRPRRREPCPAPRYGKSPGGWKVPGFFRAGPTIGSLLAELLSTSSASSCRDADERRAVELPSWSASSREERDPLSLRRSRSAGESAVPLSVSSSPPVMTREPGPSSRPSIMAPDPDARIRTEADRPATSTWIKPGSGTAGAEARRSVVRGSRAEDHPRSALPYAPHWTHPNAVTPPAAGHDRSAAGRCRRHPS